jgi:hypothetical protein
MSLSKLQGGVLRLANDAIHVTTKSIPLEDPILGYGQSQYIFRRIRVTPFPPRSKHWP